jgi:hypothetical protein
MPLLALPAHAAPAHKAAEKRAHYEVADFAEAKALVMPTALAAPARETDGLSRQDGECNFGCVDH